MSSVQTQLQTQLEELQARLSALNNDLSRSHSADSSEQAVERENDEVLEELAKETRDSIAQIKSALGRIETGKYGICDSCGEPISQARLMALPETTVCVYCAH